jgi:retron-type reverse transcriptase
MIKLDLYSQIYDIDNLVFAWRKARKHKTKKIYVKEFEMDLQKNLFKLSEELKNQTYTPEPLKTFVIRDPKTRKISKSHFRDRIIHHALVRIIEPIFEKVFIYDSCACRIGKGNLFALMRFSMFKRKITCNLRKESFCLKCDVKHYFAEVDHKVLLNIISKKIKDNKVIWLIKKILQNTIEEEDKQKPLPDDQLAEILLKKGYPIARRTIAKYREQLDIPVARMRKKM